MSPKTELQIFIVSVNVIEGAILVGLPVLVMWVTARFVRRWAAIAIGALATGFVVYLTIDTYRVCSAPPIITPGSAPESLGVAHFACDAPLGAMFYMFIWITGPICAALLLATTLFQCWQFLQQR
jgi:hypothetical protein